MAANSITTSLVACAKAQPSLNLSPKQISKNVEAELVNQVAEGNVDPLKALAQLTIMADAVNAAIETIKDEYALAEAEKYPEKSFTAYGCNFEKAELGTKYDYSQDPDKLWQMYKAQEDEAVALRKGREKTLKTLKLYSKTSKSGIKISLK